MTSNSNNSTPELDLEQELETMIQKSIPDTVKEKLVPGEVVKVKEKIRESYLAGKRHKIPKPIIPLDVLKMLNSKGVPRGNITKISMNLKSKLNTLYANFKSQAGGRRKTRKVVRRRRMTRRR